MLSQKQKQQKYKSTGQIIINRTRLCNLGSITQEGVITSQKLLHLSPSLLPACNWLSWQPCHPPCRIAEPATSHMHWGKGRFSNTFQENMLETWDLQAYTRLYLCQNDFLFWTIVKSAMIRKYWLHRIPKKVWDESPVLFFLFMRCGLCLAV